MTEALAGPYCAMLLGDLGADVDQGGTARRRRSGAKLGPAVPRRRERVLSRGQSQQAQRRDRQQGPDRFRSAATARSHARTFSSPTIRGSIRSPAAGSIPRRCARSIRGSSTPRSAATVTRPEGQPRRLRHHRPGRSRAHGSDGPHRGRPEPLSVADGGHLRRDLRLPRCARRAVRARLARARQRAPASSSTSRSSTRRRAGSRTSERATSPRASGRRGSAMRIRASRRISPCALATRP